MLEFWELAHMQCQESSVLTFSPESPFLLFLWYSFSSLAPAHTSVRDVCHFPCAHRSTTPPFFCYFHLTVSASSPPSALNQYQQTYCTVRPQNTEKYKYSLLSSPAEALLAFLSKGVCICTHACAHKHTHASKFLLNAASEQGMRLCQCEGPVLHTWGLSLFVNVFNHLFYRITPSSVSPLLFCHPMPFSGPKPAVQELFLLPFAHLE